MHLFTTITGVDDATDLGRLAEMSARFPVEWAILHSPNGQGEHPRFPSFATIDRLFAVQARTPIRLAAHLCGGHSKSVMRGEFDRSSLELAPYGRIQVNHLNPISERLREFAVPGQTVIAQWRDAGGFPMGDVGHDWLYDVSSGRGVPPMAWPVNATGRMQSYAGGIRLFNAAAIARAVTDISPAGFWLDLETGARTDDVLDLDVVERILTTLHG